MQVLDSLAKSDNALTKDDIKHTTETDSAIIEEVLESLRKLNLIEVRQNNRYSLSSDGKDIYKKIKKIIKEIGL
jgi:predicted transcriptional regulator